MKKLVSTFGLLTLMLIVTSFTTPNETGGKTVAGRPDTPINPTTPNGYDTGGKTVAGRPDTPINPTTLNVYDTGGKTVAGRPDTPINPTTP